MYFAEKAESKPLRHSLSCSS